MSSTDSKDRRVVFLDRDGVLNVDRYLTYRLGQLELVDGAVEGLSLLQALGFEFIIVTNQSAIGRGLYLEEDMHCFNEELCARLEESGIRITDVFFCPHDPVFGLGDYKRDCACRKPNPGMFFEAADKHDLELSKCYHIGDKRVDVMAGFNAGCRTILVETGILDDEHKYPGVSPDIRVKDLPKAAQVIAGELALERMRDRDVFVPPFDSSICAKLLGDHRGRSTRPRVKSVRGAS